MIHRGNFFKFIIGFRGSVSNGRTMQDCGIHFGLNIPVQTTKKGFRIDRIAAMVPGKIPNDIVFLGAYCACVQKTACVHLRIFIDLIGWIGKNGIS